MSSITHVVDSEVGEILNRYEYDAWGNLTAYEEKVPNRFKFNGQQYDSVTQQYYLRARYYNPVIGRFTQEDTYRGDGLNLYAYCANNPVYYVDPSGNIICEKAAKRIMAKFGANGRCTASRSEQKKLAAYLRNEEHSGKKLGEDQIRILNQINDYTYLSRYGQDVPSHLNNVSEQKLFARSSFRKNAIQEALDNAPTNSLKERICPTCGKVILPYIVVNTKNGPQKRVGYDLNHYPVTWAQRVERMKASDIRYTRKMVLDEYNKDLRIQCPPCNESHRYEGIRGDFADGIN